MGIAPKTRQSFRVGRLSFGSLANGYAEQYTNAGPPTNGTSGTLAGIAGKGSILIDTTRATMYQNVGTKSSPTWSCLTYRMGARAKYDFAVDGGAVGAITPTTTAVIPANAIITNVIVNSITAVTSAGAATVSIGTTAGSSATALLGATGKASFTLNGFVQAVPKPSDSTTFVKMSAAGSLNITVGTAALTAGVIEITVEYTLASA